MTRKGLVLTLITAGLMLAATSAAFDINPKQWFGKGAPASPAPALVPPPAIISGVMPNWVDSRGSIVGYQWRGT